MGEFVGWLNSLGGSFVFCAVRMLIQSSTLILILLVLDLALRRRVRAIVRYWFWLLVLVKLLLPASLSSPISLAWWLGYALPESHSPLAQVAEGQETAIRVALPSPQAVVREATGMQIPADPIVPTRPRDTPSATQTTHSFVEPTWQALILAAWLSVVMVMSVLLIQRALFVRRLVLLSEESPERLRDLLARCRKQIGVPTPVQLRLTSTSASPSVCGLVRPTILVPQRMLAQLDDRQLRSILLHELAHVRRADLWVNLAQTLLQIAYVYHPLVWLANTIIRKIREQAVDETVLAAMGDEAEEYPRTLLSVSKLAFGRPALSLQLVGVVESKKTLAARIKHMVSRPFPSSAKLGLARLVLVFAVAAVLLPMAKARHSGTKDATDPRELLEQYRKAATCWDKSVSMRVQCDHSAVYDGNDRRRWRYDVTHRRDGDRFERFGRCQFEGTHEGNTDSVNTELRDLVSDDYYLRYRQEDSGGESEARMGTDITETLLNLQTESAEGGFLQGRVGGLGAATHVAEAMCDCNEPRYIGQETLDGTLCHIVEARTEYGTFTVWLVPEKGYNALKYSLRKTGRDILYDDVRVEDGKLIEWTTTVDTVDVQKIDGVFLPVSGRLTGRGESTDGGESEEHTTAQRSEIVLRPDFKALKAFQIVLPERTEVRLEGVSERQFRWTNGKFTPDIFKYLMKSLLGRPLPSLDTIRTDLDITNTAGKMLVICFFDMQQRPSRNCMVRLAQESEALTKKGAIIFGVQSVTVEESTFREWLQANGIRVPVGTVQADEEQTRCAWGVRSLPWLILADRNHVVRAEGFDFSELQSKVETITPVTAPLVPDGAGTTTSGKAPLPSGATLGPVTEWPVADGGNGHFYQAIRMPRPLPWQEANEIAGALDGHLVTITTEAENNFVFELTNEDTYWYHGINWRGPWIGALQPPGSDEPDGGWSWVTGEPFTYSWWDTGQPNNYDGRPENRLVFGNQRSRVPTWNDVTEDFPEVVSFVVEWDKRPSTMRK